MNLHSASRTVLVVDDSLEELRILVAVLKSTGYRIIISNNGQDGLARAGLFQPDLILLDVRMPVVDGFATCRALKADPQTRDIPVIFLTAANDASSRLEGLRLGAVDYIVKPPIEEEVVLRVGIHVTKRVAPGSPAPSAQVATAPSSPEQEFPLALHLPENASVTVRVACLEVAGKPGANWSVDKLAELAGTHRKRLNDEFRACTGTTALGWVREYRMQLAAHWLGQSAMEIQGIADDLGFDSPANFSSSFKERYGVSPREFRQVMRANG